MKNNIIVYGLTRERAFTKLESILNNMRYGDIKQIVKSKDNFSIELHNRNRYIALKASDSARGYKWQYAFIDNSISEEVLWSVVFPKFIPKNKDGEIDQSINFKDRYEWF